MANLNRQQKIEYMMLLRQKKIRLARQSLWHFCQALHPEFYLDDRDHLKILCQVLQDLYERKLTDGTGKIFLKLMINLPPRHGKSFTVVQLCDWALGKSKKNRILLGSYNDDTASTFSRYTRDGIEFKKTFPYEIDYSDIFPETFMSKDNASYGEWALAGEYFNYKGAGINGTLTSKGCNMLIINDPVKDFRTAINDHAMDIIYDWYTGTFLSRKEEGCIEIIDMSRWSKKDPCGRARDEYNGGDWYVLSMPAYDKETDKMLCPSILSKESLKEKQINKFTYRANYFQEPIDLMGSLYKGLKTYDNLPVDDKGNLAIERIIFYGDTADQGSDYLCGIAAGEYKKELFIIGVYLTLEGMEITEPGTAKFMVDNKVDYAEIESNSGGRGFARAVQRILLNTHKTRKPIIKWFHQSKNKKSRIIGSSNYVMEHVYFPKHWATKWPTFFELITTYSKDGKNKYDDPEDTLTGLVEMIGKGHVSAGSSPYR